MPRRTLIDFYADLSSTAGEFVVYDDGYRSWSYSYADVASGARAFASRLRGSGIGKGDTITIWAENRAEWIIALWGCLLEGVVLVPIDYRASADFLAARVGDREGARRTRRRRGRSRRDRNDTTGLACVGVKVLPPKGGRQELNPSG